MEDKEQEAIEEGKINPLPSARYVGLFPDTYSKLVNYLQTRPFKEVAGLLQEMATNERQIEIHGSPESN